MGPSMSAQSASRIAPSAIETHRYVAWSIRATLERHHRVSGANALTLSLPDRVSEVRPYQPEDLARRQRHPNEAPAVVAPFTLAFPAVSAKGRW